MDAVLDRLSRFAADTTFSSLPAEVVHETKRTLLDALGCALASNGVRKGRMCIALSQRLGGPPESSIVGVEGRVSVTNAAMANAELINAMDYSSLFGRGGHVTPNVVPAVLALAESAGSTGQEVIRAVATAHEIALRLTWGTSPIMTVVPDGEGRQEYRWTPTYGFARFNLGAAAGAAQILGLDQERTAHAIGLAGHHSQLPSNAKFAQGEPPAAMTKYGTAGWQSTGAIVSALLAEQGYAGDTTLFEGDLGFWRMSGSETWRPERVIADLGRVWGYPSNMDYKPYPCCRLVHAAVDEFSKLMDEEGLEAGDIRSIRVIGHPYGAHPNGMNRDILTNIDAQFSVPYIFSVIAHRIPVGPRWQDEQTMQDPRILAYMDRVVHDVHPDFFVAGSRAASTGLGSVEVVTDRGVFERFADHPLGSPMPGTEFYLGDAALEGKFRGNAARLLAPDAIDRVVDAVWHLDDLADIGMLMRQLTPAARQGV